MNVREASVLMGAEADAISAELFDKQIIDFSIDSRSVKAGELFFALSQEDYARAGFNGSFADAHQFIGDAFQQGAIAAVARIDHADALESSRDRLLLVPDVIAALQTLAHRVYESWGKPSRRNHGKRGKNYSQGVDCAPAELKRASCAEERAKLQQRSGPSTFGVANGE